MKVFNLPDVGEGLTEADIVEWKVAVGDTIAVNQVFADIETAKSLVELPSPYAGTVAALHAEVGDTVQVGEALISIEEEVSAATDDGDDEAPMKPLVGTGGTSEPPAARRRRRRQAAATAPAAAVPEPEPTPEPAPPRVAAKPPVRHLARTLGINLAEVAPTGQYGEITRADIENHRNRTGPTEPVSSTPTTSSDPGHIIERTPVKGVRKATAAATTASYQQVPHVSVFAELDVTRTMELITRLKKDAAWDGVKVSPLLLAIRALVRAMGIHPRFNSTWVETGNGAEIHRYDHVNVSIAAATPRGLLVPVIKCAETLSLRQTALALAELTARAREGQTQPEEMRHGTTAITNIGALGMSAGTPILPTGHTSILALGSVQLKPTVLDDGSTIAPRHMMTLGGSFDHRVVDGADIAEFMHTVGAVLEEPALLVE